MNTRKKILIIFLIAILVFVLLGAIDVYRISIKSRQPYQKAQIRDLDVQVRENMAEQEKSVTRRPVKHEIVIAGTVAPTATPYPDFDLEHLSIVTTKENEDEHERSGIESVGEFAEDSVGTEGTEPDVETDSEFDGESDESDSDTMSELVEPEASDEVGLSALVDEYGDTEDGYSDEYAGLTYLGDWYITAYCPCEICCGPYSSGYTASGTLATAGRTIACNVLPIGTQVMIDGCIYTVEDTGWSPYDAWIDIFFDSHDQASAYGLQIREVYLVE